MVRTSLSRASVFAALTKHIQSVCTRVGRPGQRHGRGNAAGQEGKRVRAEAANAQELHCCRPAEMLPLQDVPSPHDAAMLTGNVKQF